MNPLDVHNFVRLLLEWDAERISALVTGLLFGGFAVWTYARHKISQVQEEDATAVAQKWRLRRLEEDVQAKDASLQELKKQKDDEVNELHKQLTELLRTAHAQAVQWEQAQEELSRHHDEVSGLTQRVEEERKQKQYLFDENRRLTQDRAEVQSDQLDALRQENAELQASLRSLEQRAEGQALKARELAELCERLRDAADEREPEAGRAELEEEVERLRHKIQLVTDLEGKIWEQPPAFGTPPFRPARNRVTKLIAVANLKGGVGKTTVTANLGAALAARGYRVLLVDLDYQQSLTDLCLRPEKAHQVRELGRFVRNIFRSTQAPDQVAWQNLTELTDPLPMHLLATDEGLVDDEERAKIAWLLEQSERDVRYLFRGAFHAPRFQEKFDVILFDCPPRLTTACINALAACDFVLTPVLLDKVSADAVPRLLKWLEQLRACHVCLNLSRVGIVGNEGRRHGGEWKRAHQDMLVQLQEHAGGKKLAVDVFEQVIPYKSEFAEAAERHTFAALGPTLAPVFNELVDELITRKVIHESPRLAAVH
jgi:cellulose biosynthesis protein BcsQ